VFFVFRCGNDETAVFDGCTRSFLPNHRYTAKRGPFVHLQCSHRTARSPTSVTVHRSCLDGLTLLLPFLIGRLLLWTSSDNGGTSGSRLGRSATLQLLVGTAIAAVRPIVRGAAAKLEPAESMSTDRRRLEEAQYDKRRQRRDVTGEERDDGAYGDRTDAGDQSMESGA